MTHEELVEQVARLDAERSGFNWHCICSEAKGACCDCGDALSESRDDATDLDAPTREDFRASAREAIRITGEAALKVSDEIEDGVVETICKHPNPSEIEGLDGLLVSLFRARMKIKTLTQGNTP